MAIEYMSNKKSLIKLKYFLLIHALLIIFKCRLPAGFQEGLSRGTTNLLDNQEPNNGFPEKKRSTSPKPKNPTHNASQPPQPLCDGQFQDLFDEVYGNMSFL